MNTFSELDVSKEIRDILEEYDVDFVFQPIYSRMETIIGYEALMRPNGKFVLEFIEEMKKNNKLHDLEVLTFFGATHKYKERGYNTLLSINSFPSEVFTELELIEYNRCFGLTRDKIIVEILEYGDDENWTWAKKSMHLNDNTGIEIALDDFGTGYNDESAVDYYNPHMIKIDRSLITDIDKDKEKQDRVNRIVKNMHDKLIVVLAEGIETEAEYKYLKDAGIDFFQGYYLGRPA